MVESPFKGLGVGFTSQRLQLENRSPISCGGSLADLSEQSLSSFTFQYAARAMQIRGAFAY